MMMRAMRSGVLAGLLAGFLAALLFVVDYGPANSLHGVARWFALDSQAAGRVTGLLLMLLLGAAFGAIFGVLTGRGPFTLGKSLGIGLLIGAIWWVLVAFGLGTLVNHLRLDFGSWLFYFVPLLVYGLLLGSFSYQWRRSV
jgi:hypothetical protein